jgi:peptidoglycan-associated lipoprotein
MRIFAIAAVAVSLLLVAACQTAPDRSGSASCAGGSGAGMAGGAGVGAGGGAGAGGTGAGVGAVDRYGVEGPMGAESAARELAEIGDTVYFAFDEHALSPEGRVIVERQAALLMRSPSLSVRIDGHTDERGTREYNLALGDRRSNSVKDYLVTLGVDPMRITTVSYGEERPAVLGSDETAWARNRRAVTVIAGSRVGS